MTELQQIRAALDNFAADNGRGAANILIYEAIRDTETPLAIPPMVRQLQKSIPKVGPQTARQILAAIGRLREWGR